MMSLYLERLTVQSVLYALRWKQKLGVFCAKLHVCVYMHAYIKLHIWMCVLYIYFFLFLGDSFSQFRFAEEKEWDGETSCPKQVREMF